MNEALYDFLVRRLSEEGMPADTSVAVAELHRRLVPYPLARSALGIGAKTEYDVALLRLLADAELIDLEEDALRTAVAAELRTAEPGLAVLHRFAASPVHVRRGWEDSRPDAGPDAGDRRGPPLSAAEGVKMADELPGLDEKDVEVSLAGGALTIRGEKQEEKEEKKKDYYLSERHYGSFERMFNLPQGVDPDNIEARFSKGLLTISMPKKPEAIKPEKSIPVKAG